MAGGPLPFIKEVNEEEIKDCVVKDSRQGSSARIALLSSTARSACGLQVNLNSDKLSTF